MLPRRGGVNRPAIQDSGCQLFAVILFQQDSQRFFRNCPASPLKSAIRGGWLSRYFQILQLADYQCRNRSIGDPDQLLQQKERSTLSSMKEGLIKTVMRPGRSPPLFPRQCPSSSKPAKHSGCIMFCGCLSGTEPLLTLWQGGFSPVHRTQIPEIKQRHVCQMGRNDMLHAAKDVLQPAGSLFFP